MTNVLTRGYVLAAGSVLDPLYTALGYVLATFYAAIPNYGVAIILLTVAVRLVLYPLTVKQTKSMQAMQRLQPEIKRLQAKYKNDRQKLNEEMMKFYKENKVNPLAGCLPLLLQMPLFIVLYRLIHDLTATVIAGAVVVGGAGAAGGPVTPTYKADTVKVSNGTIDKKTNTLDGSITAEVLGPDTRPVGQLQGTVTDNQIHGKAKGDPAPIVDPRTDKQIGTIAGARVDGARLGANPKHIPTKSKLAHELKDTPGEMRAFGMDLAKRPSQGKGAEVIGLYLLVALTVLTGYYQQRQMTARTPASAQNPQMQMMGKIFPLFFGFISLQIPAGVVLYFVVSNLWQIGQQAIIFRQQDAAEAVGKDTKATKNDAKASGAITATATPKAPANPSGSSVGGGGNPSSGRGSSGGGGSGNRSRRRKRRRRGR